LADEKVHEELARYRDTGTEELGQELTQLQRKLAELRFQASRNQLDNTMAIRECRKSIARLKTVLRERELAGQA